MKHPALPSPREVTITGDRVSTIYLPRLLPLLFRTEPLPPGIHDRRDRETDPQDVSPEGINRIAVIIAGMARF